MLSHFRPNSLQLHGLYSARLLCQWDSCCGYRPHAQMPSRRTAPTPARPCVNFKTLGCEDQTECLKALPARVPGPSLSGTHTHAQRAPSPVVQQTLEVLEEEVSVLINEALHRVPGGGPGEGQ